jgi:hypothetical protein
LIIWLWREQSFNPAIYEYFSHSPSPTPFSIARIQVFPDGSASFWIEGEKQSTPAKNKEEAMKRVEEKLNLAKKKR